MDVLEPVIRFFRQQRELGQDSIHLEQPLSKVCSKEEQLRKIQDQCQNCRLCQLWKGRTQIVFGDGDVNARIVVVGEAPGRDEDIQGIP
ncbi:MAG TPA: uracil-DNA glycosylase, partial [bacterium]|nr:uracil-DNA glycosylase [bacterium]